MSEVTPFSEKYYENYKTFENMTSLQKGYKIKNR